MKKTFKKAVGTCMYVLSSAMAAVMTWGFCFIPTATLLFPLIALFTWVITCVIKDKEGWDD